MAKSQLEKLLREMVEAHTDLTIFSGIISLLEGGTVSADAQPDDFKVIALCNRAAQRCLTRYDRARDALRAIEAQRSSPTDRQRP